MKTAPSKKARITYAAFLRGINVGGNTLIKMEELRKAFESFGYSNVKTVLASGNVLFDAPPESLSILSRNITLRLQESLGHKILVIVLTIDDLRKLEARQPFKDIMITPQTRLFVTFISKSSDHPETSGLSNGDGFRILSVSDGVICSMLDEKPDVGAIQLMGSIEKEYGKDVTTRTWNTIARLLKASNK